MSNPGVDLILPVYRPKPGWELHVCEGLAALTGHFGRRGIPIRFYLVNDGSDAAFFPKPVLEKLRAAAPGFHFLSYQRNRGKGYSLRYGVAQTQGTYQIYTDGDFPFGWDGVIQVYEQLVGGADVVMGIRGRDYTSVLPPLRKWLSQGVRKLNRVVLGLPPECLDAQAGLKGFNPAGREAFLATTVDTFLFDTEFIVLAWQRGLNITTVNLVLREGLHFSRMGFKVMFRELWHLVRIFVRYRGSGGQTGCGGVEHGETADEEKRADSGADFI